MCAAGWPLTLVLIRLIGSATSSPFTTPAPHLLQHQISPHPINKDRSPSSLDLPTPTFSAESMTDAECNLRISPSVLVVRFGDPAKANCSKPSNGFPMMGWVNTKGDSNPTSEGFLVWSVEMMTEWSISPICYAISDLEGSCNISLTLIVYKPPKRVSIQFLNHTGPMVEGRHYTLQCTVQDVAPVENLLVTFYRGQTPLGQVRSNRTAEKQPVNESFPLTITPFIEDNGTHYWCEAKLELGPSGPQRPPVETSQNLTAVILESIHPTKLPMKDLNCDVKTNHEALGSGTSNSYKGWFLLIALSPHLIN